MGEKNSKRISSSDVFLTIALSIIIGSISGSVAEIVNIAYVSLTSHLMEWKYSCIIFAMVAAALVRALCYTGNFDRDFRILCFLFGHQRVDRVDNGITNTNCKRCKSWLAMRGRFKIIPLENETNSQEDVIDYQI